MTRVFLKPHPDTPCDAVSSITVEMSRPRPTSLALRYVVTGDVSRLVVPGRLRPSDPVELWRTTCFEAFIRKGARGGYYEFNISPSGEWVVYDFWGYREGMTLHPGVESRDLERQSDDQRLELAVVFDLDRLGLATDAPWRMALSTVLEEKSGAMSYWALAHAPGKPDFHNLTAFAHDLDPA